MRLILISLLLLLVNCPGHDSNQASNRAREIPMGQEFELKIDQEAKIKGERLKAKFISVLEDSRCPKGVQCIQAGRGRVAIQLKRGDKKAETVELSTDSTGQETDFDGYQVKLISLNPYPIMDRPLKPADYVLILAVRKGQSSGNTTTNSLY